MRILLDENIPIQLKAMLRAEIIDSVNKIGWKQISDGALLARMEGVYDLLITADQNIYAQQNLTGRSIAVIALASNRKSEVMALAPIVQNLIDQIIVGQYGVVQRDGAISVR